MFVLKVTLTVCGLVSTLFLPPDPASILSPLPLTIPVISQRLLSLCLQQASPWFPEGPHLDLPIGLGGKRSVPGTCFLSFLGPHSPVRQDWTWVSGARSASRQVRMLPRGLRPLMRGLGQGQETRRGACRALLNTPCQDP